MEASSSSEAEKSIDGGSSSKSSTLAADKEQVLTNRMRHIVTHFRKRAFNVRKKIEEPNSLDASSDDEDENQLFSREIKNPVVVVDENVVDASAAAQADDNNRGGKVNKRFRPNSSFHHTASDKGLMEKLKE